MADLDTVPRVRLCRLYADLADYAEDFCRTARVHGVGAARTFLGAYVEWLGVDLADATVLLPPDLWADLDARADDLLEACETYLGCGDYELLAPVEAIGAGARARTAGSRPRSCRHPGPPVGA